ncbi:MAG: hypothetical protein A2161_00190 [Candidatus Schekmanbacteria bacterium RBG_13_48_7]|uniref:DUF1573 domain-containing protein n=1 Tax=Candidatus Schekmanbacteria bacterium RBG_13_48_7 TaxID=1817878 RepID=A0A1F7RZS3_9BACT|nr:MAG: hypothetical protein A2161_00190 [Candidatus Schekmanbacteria bacterium RBG_13_48_7]
MNLKYYFYKFKIIFTLILLCLFIPNLKINIILSETENHSDKFTSIIQNGPIFFCKNDSVYFEKIFDGQNKGYSFEIENIGDSSLKIIKVCPGDFNSWSEISDINFTKEILPHEKGYINVNFLWRTSFTEILKTFYMDVYTNDPSNSVFHLKISAKVVKEIYFYPCDYVYFKKQNGKINPINLILINASGIPINSLSITHHIDNLQVKYSKFSLKDLTEPELSNLLNVDRICYNTLNFDDLKKFGEYTLKFELNENNFCNNFKGKVEVLLDNPNYKKREIGISGNNLGDFIVNPTNFFMVLNNKNIKEPITKVIELKKHDGINFKIIDIYSTHEFFTFAWDKRKIKNRYEIIVSYIGGFGGFPIGKAKGLIYILTDSKKCPAIEIPAYIKNN